MICSFKLEFKFQKCYLCYDLQLCSNIAFMQSKILGCRVLEFTGSHRSHKTCWTLSASFELVKLWQGGCARCLWPLWPYEALRNGVQRACFMFIWTQKSFSLSLMTQCFGSLGDFGMIISQYTILIQAAIKLVKTHTHTPT